MIAPDAHLKVYVATRPVDFRKGHDGLAAAVQEMIGKDPFSGAVFVFRSKRADRVKVLVWDGTGLVLIHKRLEGGKFVWPQVRDGVMRLSAAQFAALLSEAAGLVRPCPRSESFCPRIKCLLRSRREGCRPNTHTQEGMKK
jgi:transposase